MALKIVTKIEGQDAMGDAVSEEFSAEGDNARKVFEDSSIQLAEAMARIGGPGEQDEDKPAPALE